MKQRMLEWLKQQSIYQNMKQILLIGTVVCAFLVSVCIGRSTVAARHRIFQFLALSGGIVCLAGWLEVGREKVTRFLHGNRRRQRKRRKWNTGCFLLLLYTAVIRLPQFGDIPRYDGLAYYNMLSEACQNYDFTFTGFLNGFRMAAHPTQGYMGLLAIGKFLDPEGYTGIMLVNLILSVITSYCVFMIFKKILRGVSWKYVTVLSVLTVSVPSYLGTFSYLNPDMGLVYFFLMAVYCMLYSRYILMIFCFLLLALTKEIGMVMAAANLTGMALWLMWEKRQMIRNGLTKRRLFYVGFAGMILLLLAVTGIYVVLGGSVWNYQRDEIAYFGTIGIHWEFILFKWKEYFLLNFNWVAVLLIFVGLIYLRISRKTLSFRMRERAVICGARLSYLAVAVFYSLYVNFPHPRYTIILDVLLWAAAAGLTGKITADLVRENGYRSVASRRGMIAGCLLLIIQSYMTIDPVSILAFPHSTTGGSWMLNVYSEFIGWTGGGDATIYNNQYRYLTSAYDLILNDVNYSEDMDVIMFSGLDELEDPFWNIRDKKRTFEENGNTIVVNCVYGNDLDNTEEKKTEAVFLYVPAFGNDRQWELDAVGKYYDLVYNGVTYVPGGGNVEYWKCRLKEA